MPITLGHPAFTLGSYGIRTHISPYILVAEKRLELSIPLGPTLLRRVRMHSATRLL